LPSAGKPPGGTAFARPTGPVGPVSVAPPGNTCRTQPPFLKLSHLSHADSTFATFLVIVSYLDV